MGNNRVIGFNEIQWGSIGKGGYHAYNDNHG